jgi:hypothetical protein
MLIPFTCKASDVIRQENLDDQTPCMCGSQVRIGDKLCAWTHVSGQAEYHWFSVCAVQCLLRHVVEGHA